MSWATTEILEATVRSLAYRTFYNPEVGDADMSLITGAMTSGAKQRVETDVLARISPVVKKLGGITAFFDAAVADGELAARLQDLLLHAVLETYFFENSHGPSSHFFEGAQRSESHYKRALESFVMYAPMNLSDVDDPPTLRPARSRVTDATANYGSGYS